MTLLEWMEKKGSVTTREVAEYLGVSLQNALRKLKVLERRGLVERIGGSKGRGKTAVWKVKDTLQEPDSLRCRLTFLIGKSLAWINSQERNWNWSIFNISEDPLATILALIVNAEIGGRIPDNIPALTKTLLRKKESLLTRLGTKEAYLEFLVLAARYLHFTRQTKMFEKVRRNVEKKLLSYEPRREVSPEVFVSALLFLIKPYVHLLSEDVIQKLLRLLPLDPIDGYRGKHRTLAIAWSGVALLSYGYVKEATLLFQELLLRAHRTENEIYIEDAPPFYLEKLFGLKRESLDPTTLLFFLSYKLGREREATMALKHIERHQNPDGGFQVSPEIPPDVIRNSIITLLLFEAQVKTSSKAPKHFPHLPSQRKRE